jgi:hypothetical protein
MPYSLQQAATATGLNKSTVLRAIKAGKVSAVRDEQGQWQVEPAELDRVYPPVGGHRCAAAGRNRGCSGARNGEPAGRPGRRTAGRVEGHARGHAMRPRCVALGIRGDAAGAAEAGAREADVVVEMVALDGVKVEQIRRLGWARSERRRGRTPSIPRSTRKGR